VRHRGEILRLHLREEGGEMKRSKLAFIVLGLVLGLLVAVTGAAGSAQKGPPGNHGKGHTNARMSWDVVGLNFATLTLSPGGHASAFATGSGGTAHAGKITVTGHGTFRSNPGRPQSVTGGGTWQTFDAANVSTGSGTYKVTGFVDFDLAPGSVPANFTDNSGNKADAHSGLAVFKIAYSDGSDGTLTVSCDLPAGSPPTLFEGITATKGYVDYWERDPAVANVDANRTIFHTL
jgi:hypothetical protein